MNADKESSLDNKIEHLENIVSCQKEEICKLKRKLETFNEVVAERDILRELSNDFEQWKEKNKHDNMKLFNELKTTCEDQAEKLKRSMVAECKCEAKRKELQNVNDSINCQLKTLKLNENKLQCELEEAENKMKCIQKELCSTQSELEEANRSVKKLKTDLITNEDELCKLRGKHEECIRECTRLNETNQTLKADLHCIKIKLDDTILCASRTEEKYKNEQETLCDELKNINKKLICTEKQYDEANRKLNEDKCSVKKLVSTLLELKETSVRHSDDLKKQIQKLKKDNNAKDDSVCRLKKKVKQLQRDNEFYTMEINEQKNKLREKDCQLKQLKLLSEKIVQIKKEIDTNRNCQLN